MLAASIDALAAPSSAGQVQMETNVLAAWSKTLQQVESAELNLLAQMPLGRAIEWAESRFDQIVAEAENAFDTMVDALVPLFTGTQGGQVNQASSPPPAPPNTSSSPRGGIRPMVGPLGGSSKNPIANNDSYSQTHDDTFSVDAASGVLANDTDPNHLPLSAVFVSGPSNGTVTLNSNGSFLYTPKAGWTGSDSFQYYATDGLYNSNNATVTIAVQDNGTISTQPSSYSTPHDQALSVDASSGVLANDSDSDGDGLTASLASGPSNGSLQLNADGSFTYTPNAGYSGSDSFQYTAGDGAKKSAPTTVSLNITNTGPTAVNHTYGIPENTARSVTGVNGLLDGVSDSDGDYLALTSWTQPSDGTLQVNPDGSFSYTPKSNYSGSDSFQYTLSDGAANSTATVTLNVHATNTAPVANADSYSVERNNEFDTDPSTGVLANDTDANGDPLSATLVSGPTDGTLTLNSDGSFEYVPNTNFSGTDRFTYKASDGVANSAAATVTLTVGTTAPTAADQGFDLKENTALNAPAGALQLSASNPDDMTLTAQDVTHPSNGTVSVNANGSFVYTPTSGFTGTDSFTYDLTDGGLTSSPATVTIYVNASDTAPTVTSLSYTTDENNALSDDASSGVLTGASDSDGDSLLATLVSGPTNGTLTLNLDGSFTYTPNTNFTGTDSFQYDAFDGSGYSTAATVTITVTSDVPTANNDTYGVHPNSTVNVTGPGVLANDTDADGMPLSATLVSGVSHGSLTLNSDGSFSYTPNSGFTGTDSFTYQANNDLANSNTATVTLNVHSTNTAPTATNDSYSTTANAPLTMLAAGGVLANDSDPDNDPLTSTLVSSTSHGSVTLNSDGSFTYTPNTNFIGTDTFTYEANDGLANSNTATVSISVTDTAPSAADNSYTITHDQTLTVNAAAQALAEDPNNQGGLVSVNLVIGPSNGTLQFGGNGSIIYKPDYHFVGTDSFTYETNDGMLNSSPATVYIYVTNAAPVAADDNYSVTSGNTLNVTATSGVLANADDPDSDATTAQLVSGTTNGSLTLNSDGSFTYIPHSGFSGNDSFTYAASDGIASSNTATVTITVMAVNATAPVANNDEFATGMNQAFSSSAPGVLWSAVAPPGKTLTAVPDTSPANGTVTLNSDGSFTYTPDTGFTGTDSFTYFASAGGVKSSSPATVTIQVGNVNLSMSTQWVPINANDDNGSPLINGLIPKIRDFNYLEPLPNNRIDPQLVPLAFTILNPLPNGYVQLAIQGKGVGSGTIRLWRNQNKQGGEIEPGFYPTSGPGALPTQIYVEGVTPTARTIANNAVQYPPTPDTIVTANYWAMLPWMSGTRGSLGTYLGTNQVKVGVTPVVQFFTINNQNSPPNPMVGQPEAGRIAFGDAPPLGENPNSFNYGFQTFGVNPTSKTPNAPVRGQEAATFNAQVFRENAPGSLHLIQNIFIINGFLDLQRNAYTFGWGGPGPQNYVLFANKNAEAFKDPILDMVGGPLPYYLALNKTAPANYAQITAGDSPMGPLEGLEDDGLNYGGAQKIPVSEVNWTFSFTDYLVWTMPAGGNALGNIIYPLATQKWSVSLFAFNNGGSGGWANTLEFLNKLSGVFVPGDFAPSDKNTNPVITSPIANDAVKIR
jgi:VCBS repeat-containing protein